MDHSISIPHKETVARRTGDRVLVMTGWKRVVLLIVLGYEALGCLLGGTLLTAGPDGSYMDMPVDLMHGVFPDFLVPGILLFCLGILTSFAFLAVLRGIAFDWFLAGLSLVALLVWFITEIIILQELHWLHAMWGLPVLLGWIVAIPLVLLRHDSRAMRKLLLFCGILSSLWYVAINIVVPMSYPGYDWVSLTVSELSAIGAPTRILWVLLVLFYPLLLAAFGWGVLYSAGHNRRLRITGKLIIVYCLLNLYWPAMHQRELIGAGGGTLTDTLHIGWAMVSLLFMMLMMGFGAGSLGKKFRLFSIAIFIVFVVFGVLIGTESGGIRANLPTPHLGMWERINIGTFMGWIIVFALALLRKPRRRD